jgi:transposase
MIYAGIDVSKDKHDCCILDSDGKKLFPVFTIPNNRSGFNELFAKLAETGKDMNEIIVGLEATGHYSRNLLKSLIDKGLTTYVINPLHTNLYRKGLSLRKTKTDQVDASTIAFMLMTDKALKPYTLSSYHNDELKSLTRYRFDKVQDCAKLKTSLARLVNILFPELEKLVSTIHSASVYALLTEFPGASNIANCHLTHLTNLLSTASRGCYGREKAIAIRNAARISIGYSSSSLSMELKHTIHLIQEMNKEIADIEREIKNLMSSLKTVITTIPGISFRLGAMILAEIGDFSRFENADQILAFAGLSPSTYQSGQLTSSHAKMEKRGSRYLRYALFNATKYVCRWAPDFSVYLAKKLKEGKHYNVAISHAAKKLVRVIFAMARSGEAYRA